MDGAAAGSGGPSKSPHSHGRHDAEKGKLGASIQYDLAGIAATGGGAGSVPGRGKLKTQRFTQFFADGYGLWASRDRNATSAASNALQHLQHLELLQQRFADASSSGPSSGSVAHCYTATLLKCQSALSDGSVTKANRASNCTCGSCSAEVRPAFHSHVRLFNSGCNVELALSPPLVHCNSQQRRCSRVKHAPCSVVRCRDNMAALYERVWGWSEVKKRRQLFSVGRRAGPAWLRCTVLPASFSQSNRCPGESCKAVQK
jgi:hypothetical protein